MKIFIVSIMNGQYSYLIGAFSNIRLAVKSICKTKINCSGHKIYKWERIENLENENSVVRFYYDIATITRGSIIETYINNHNKVNIIG